VNYKGPICIESFKSANKTIARSASSGGALRQHRTNWRSTGSAFLHNLLDESRVDEAVDAKQGPPRGPPRPSVSTLDGDDMRLGLFLVLFGDLSIAGAADRSARSRWRG